MSLMRSLSRPCILGFATCLSSVALGANLFTPFALDSAQVLPKGVRNMRVIGFTSQISGKFDGSASVVPVGQPFNKTVRVGELIGTQKPGFERDKLRGGLESYGIGADTVAGEAHGVVNSRVTSTVPVLAYGLTDRLTVVAAVPVVYSNTSVRSGWTINPAFEQQLKALAGRGFANKLIEFRDQLENVVSAKIAANGYKPLEDLKRTEVGDFTFGAKYQFAKGPRSAAALASRLVLPTGRTPDVDRVVDVGAGNGSLDAGLGLVYDYSVLDTLTVSASTSYTYPFAGRRAMRIPYSQEESLTPDVDRDAGFKAGDVLAAGLATRIRFEETVTFGVGYSFQTKRPDSYSGSKYAGERYQYLSRDSEQQMHALHASVTYSTIPLFQKRKFPLPLEATLGLSSVIAGINVNRAALSTFDVAAFF